PSPEDAVKALIEAVKTDNIDKFVAVLGSGSKSLFSSGDEVEDRAGMERFVKSYEEKNRIEKKGADRAILYTGNDDYPMPIPIVKKGQSWHFDTKAGKEELLTRRIGRNELQVIDVMETYVDAQREYIKKDWDNDGLYVYAQRLVSTPGKKDGLYWDAKEGEEQSPFGPLVAQATAKGYTKEGRAEKPTPFHGYYFRILKAQGSHAPGGAYDYVSKGKMILGFGLMAYPAKYGSSGIMTFIVNQDGIVYQRNLGKQTAKTAGAMVKYDPDKTWTKVE
ncbi:MAG TPA: DUF2950 domain-containing protein, partial [Thermodesulfovibrionales bacterium]|nr:DUF2950 domain-containing protein [Thermodesulfovibrionales bacterium]